MSSQIVDQILPLRRRAYDSDLTDEEWAIVRLLVEIEQIGPGPRRSVNLREVVNALLYKQRTGCQWRLLPHDLPPRSTVSGYYQRWSKTGVLEKMYALLRQPRMGDMSAAFSSSAVKPDMPAFSRVDRQRQVFADHIS